MKIKMTGPNSATLTKGWFRKYQAEVHRPQGPGTYWYFVKSGKKINVGSLDSRLDWVAKRYNKKFEIDSDWKPVTKKILLPEAKVVDARPRLG